MASHMKIEIARKAFRPFAVSSDRAHRDAL